MDIRVGVKDIVPLNNESVLIELESLDDDEPRSLGIYVGIIDAIAIANAKEGAYSPRPQTHQLMNSLVNALGAVITKVVVAEIINSTFHALIYLRRGEEEIKVDCRPSDAIALALRVGRQIYVEESLMEYSDLGGSARM